MKVATSVRKVHEELSEGYVRLKSEVDDRLQVQAKRSRWHYESRIKSEESVALKLETGRIPNVREIEDFFACTLVVRNLAEISAAEVYVASTFDIVERRPELEGKTHKKPEAFPFDDLRLIVRWKDDPALPPSEMDGLVFEVQVKTFLQHAWGIATHDLSYKSDNISWARARIAFQVKAMLEHAEISIQEADALSSSTALDKVDEKTIELRRIQELISNHWDQSLLPSDVVRLCQNVQTVLRIARTDLEDLNIALTKEAERNGGDLPINISPYQIVVQSLSWHAPRNMRNALNSKSKRNTLRVLVSQEMDVPDWLRDARNSVCV